MPAHSQAVAAAPGPATPRPCAPEDWQKRGVVLSAEPDGPLENFTSAAEPLPSGHWRLWFTTTGAGRPRNVGFAEGKPGDPMARQLAVLGPAAPAEAPLAIGNLPQGWRPVQAVHLRLQSGRHRLYFWAHGPKVVRYLAADSDDGRRYRVLDPLRPCLYHPNDRAVDGKAAAEAGLLRLAKKVGAPADNEPSAPARLVSNDATNVYQLPDGSFEMYSVGLVEITPGQPGFVPHDNVPGWLRVIDRYTSEDGLHWTDRRRVIVRDQQDPADQQFYYLAVTHTPQGRMGMLGNYRVEAQTMDLEWCFSRDGIHWQRLLREAWIPRGKPGDPDSYLIHAPHAIVLRDGQWHLFYSGSNTAHNHRHSYGPPTQVVMYATCRQPWT